MNERIPHCVNRNTTDVEALLREIQELNQENAKLQKALKAAEEKNVRLEERVHNAEESLDLVLNSNGHQLLNRYYGLIQGVRDRILRMKTALRNIKNLPKELVSLLKRRKAKVLTGEECYAMLKKCKRIDILAVKHTAYVANLLQEILLGHGIESHVLLDEPEQYDNIPYIIVCPQNFRHFPSCYVAFQMEQTVSQRWLTDEYLQILRNAYAVFDYSLVNIDYFSKDPELAKKLFYLPLDVCHNMAENNNANSEKEYDVLFYGAIGDSRRKAFLDRIGETYKVRIISDCFGTALYKEMQKAKLIVNIHFYENALLETTRLYEALSVCDGLIISERSTDPNEEIRLEGIVDFVDVDDVDAMMERIAYWLTHEAERTAWVTKARETLFNRPNAAAFYLNRFLLANDRLTFDEFYKASGDFVHFGGDRICLNLPESTDRTATFNADNHYGFEFMPGLKHRIGWIGCGMSYKFIFQKALEQQLGQVVVCEDDVYFPADFSERFRHILDYAASHDDWNIFSGIMGDMGDVTLLDCVEDGDETFAYLDKMMSMVFNIYSPDIFRLIADWDNTNYDKDTNTIDRYLENKVRRVLTTCPFLVGHKEDLDSTIWNHKNDRYNPGIESSSKKLHMLIDDYHYNQNK